MTIKSGLDRRRAGVLLHPTSLPGPGGVGCLGADALHFIDFLADCGVTVWQTLPLGPTHGDKSPYHCQSVHAGDPGLIDVSALETWGWLPKAAIGAADAPRAALLAQARLGFDRGAEPAEREAYAAFVARSAPWLDDFALYQALRGRHDDRPWWMWPEPERDRDSAALAAARQRLADDVEGVRFEQYLFFKQWKILRDAARRRGVLLFGDMPIFVAHDSADVWAHREYFMLDRHGQPVVVAGVPPDYFSELGQRWGNPLYRWDRIQDDGFRWWLERMRTQLELFDLVRIDHFRGFEAYWEIPADHDTAVHGRWVKAPGEALFRHLRERFDPLPVVVEDLGIITPEVDALRQRFGLPGMRVLQFAFEGGPDNPYLPHNYEANTVVYTGTHDNDTTLSWFNGLPPARQQAVREYLGFPGDDMPWMLARAALASVARLAIVPMQDVLGLGNGYRMNTPGTAQDNWLWRFSWDQIAADTSERLRTMVEMYGRV